MQEEAEREERIAMEIVVDCHDGGEAAMGWYSCLQEALSFPFRARCEAERAVSPLRHGEEVEVVDMGPEAECARKMFVFVRWSGRKLAVPLSQLGVDEDADEGTVEGAGDWRYWVARGREF